VADESAAVATAIRNGRVAKGLSQVELAQQLGVKQQSVSRWEAGEALPRPPMFVKLSDVLEVPLTDLLGGGADYLEGRRSEIAADLEADGQGHDVMDDVTINFNAPPDQVPPEALEAIKTLLRPYFEK